MKFENKGLQNFVDESVALCTPDKVVLIDGSEEQLEALRAEACSTGEMIKLNQELLPGCYLHRTAVNDVARVEGRTFICTEKKEDAGPTNNWMQKDEAYKMLKGIFKGSMKGRTMYVIPYSMGAVGSPFSKIGIELTDSIYVVLNMAIMTRVGQKVLDTLGPDGDFVRLRAAHSVLSGQTGRVARGAYAHPGSRETGRRDEVYRGGIPLRVRQD